MKKNKVKKVKKFVINRAKWRCGDAGDNQRGEGSTKLLNNEGYMCCLGQISCQLGAKKADINNHYSPSDIRKELPILVKTFDYDGNIEFSESQLSDLAMEINDDEELSDKLREKKLASLFSKYKHKLEFKGLYRDAKGKVIKE